MSGLLTGVVVVLVVCHTPKTFLNIQVSTLGRGGVQGQGKGSR